MYICLLLTPTYLENFCCCLIKVINTIKIVNSKVILEIQNKTVSIKLLSQQSVSDMAVGGVNLNSICHCLCGEHFPECKLASQSRRACQKTSNKPTRRGLGRSNSNEIICAESSVKLMSMLFTGQFREVCWLSN